MKVKKRVRVRASITRNSYGGYRVVLSNGVYSDYATLEDAQRRADRVNNEDSDYPEYMTVIEEVEDEESNAPAPLVSYWERMEEAHKKRQQEKREAEDRNRKSRKTDEKYIFVVSCLLRGESYTMYLQGETDLTKITAKHGGGFVTTKEEEAKVFQTKASAQKFIDKLSKCWMVKATMRSMKVVRKPRK